MFRDAGGSIVCSEEPLTPEYLPDKLPGREQTIADIARSLTPALSHRKPIHIWIHGPPGTAALRGVTEPNRDKPLGPLARRLGYRLTQVGLDHAISPSGRSTRA